MKIKIHLPDVIGKGYASFWHTKKRYRVLKGGRGSKKSCNAAINGISNIMKYPLANMLVVRKTYNTHKDSTYAQLKWAARRLGVYDKWEFTINPLECRYKPTGQKIIFRGYDDPLKLTSITVDVGVLCWVWIEEAYEIEDEADFDTLDESIRGEMPEGLWKQLTLTFNPWVNSHWTKARFFDREDPNAFTLTTTYLCNEWLDEGDKKKIEDLKFTNPERYKVVGLGDYGSPGGTYFEEFRSDIHVVDMKPSDIPEWWKRFRAMDYGLDMLAVAWFAVDPLGDLLIYREVYESGLNLTNAAKKVLAMSPFDEEISYTVASPDLFNRPVDRMAPRNSNGQQEKNYGVPEVETMIKAGLKGIIRADNRRVPGWRNLREYLSIIERVAQDGTVYQTARLRIFKTCPNAIRTLSAIIHDEKDYEDVADEPHELTHMPEAIRYGCMSRPPRPVEKTPPSDGRPDRHSREARTARRKPLSDVTNY